MKSTSNVGHVRDQVGEISDEFERQYGNVLKNVKIKYNPTFDSRIDQIINDPKRGLTPDARNELRNVIRGYYHDMFPQYTGMGNRATVTGDRAKQFEAFLTKQEQNWRKATNNPQSSNIAGILDDLEADWTNAYRSGLPVNVQKTLKPLDDQYSKFATVREAATSLGNDYGDFTPEQLLAAVKKRTARPRFAESGGIMQRPAEVGKDVFSERTRSSGTIERGALGAFGLGLLVDPLTTLGTTGAATGGAFLSTTGPGKNLLLGQTRPQKLLQRLKADKGARALGMPLGLGGVQSITDEDILEQ